MQGLQELAEVKAQLARVEGLLTAVEQRLKSEAAALAEAARTPTESLLHAVEVDEYMAGYFGDEDEVERLAKFRVGIDALIAGSAAWLERWTRACDVMIDARFLLDHGVGAEIVETPRGPRSVVGVVAQLIALVNEVPPGALGNEGVPSDAQRISDLEACVVQTALVLGLDREKALAEWKNLPRWAEGALTRSRAKDLAADLAAAVARAEKAEADTRVEEARGAPDVVSWCPQCGPEPRCDEDGCCSSCGATVGDVPDWRPWKARAERAKEQRDRAKAVLLSAQACESPQGLDMVVIMAADIAIALADEPMEGGEIRT